MSLLAICISSLIKWLFKYFAHFLIRFFCLLELWEFFICSGYVLYQINDLYIFSLNLWLFFFASLMMPFEEQEFLIYHFYYFIDYALGVISLKSLPNLTRRFFSKVFFGMFQFWLSYLGLSSIFLLFWGCEEVCCEIRVYVHFFFQHRGIHCLSTICWKNYCISLANLSKVSSVQWLSHVRLFETPWTSAHQASLSKQLPEFTQTHVHWVGDAIQPSHPLVSPSPPALNLSQHWGLFKWVSSSHQVAKVLEFHLQHQSFQWTPRTDLP